MILTIDIGNTESTLALFDGSDVVEHWRLSTDGARTPDETGLLLRSLLASRIETGRDLQGAAIASVVPFVTDVVSVACERWLRVSPLRVEAASSLPIVLDVEEPLTVGADRIANTLAASILYGRDAIVVDLGTATTFDCITADGVFLGGVISPGVRISAETLFRRTSKLPAPDLTQPARVIGRRTEECIRAGVLYGAVDAIDGIVRRIRSEWPRETRPYAIATGGLAEEIAPHCSELDRIDPLLTMQGINLAYSHLLRQPE